MKTIYILTASVALIMIGYMSALLMHEKTQENTLPTQENVLPIYGETNKLNKGSVVSIGRIVQLKKEDEITYREMHADVWPEVIATISKANIRNYQLYVGTIDNKRYLFSHFEYHGTDINKDLATIRANPIMNDKWLPITDSYQIKMPNTGAGQQWLKLESIMQLE